MTTMEVPGLETFAAAVRSKFVMHYAGNGSAELELIAANDLGSSARHSQFSLIFQGPNNGPLVQGVYRLDHKDLGSLDVFLVPIEKDGNGVRYEAVFNRLIKE